MASVFALIYILHTDSVYWILILCTRALDFMYRYVVFAVSHFGTAISRINEPIFYQKHLCTYFNIFLNVVPKWSWNSKMLTFFYKGLLFLTCRLHFSNFNFHSDDDCPASANVTLEYETPVVLQSVNHPGKYNEDTHCMWLLNGKSHEEIHWLMLWQWTPCLNCLTRYRA